MGQHSVFIVPSEDMRGVDNNTWLNIGTPEFLEDPDNDEAHWITVILPAEMNDTHTDEAIMAHAYQVIRDRQAVVSDVAQHNLGVVCISIPVPVDAATDEMWVRAEVDAGKWLIAIRDGMVTLNRELIFQASQGLLCSGTLERKR
ncbi:hypothetical protein N7517_009114 [Penicillium concentricum]|uniref:Uncharacterized protein n=1 Tax=Penicillium concentricum TaxID=293559 RepID=A0A9W9RLU3_9EURO|nr:uncharacterized protein N7517_009114 [Penicillium concentricum]KAJ5359923.1 hypothetical protein N7517_009114 [Penicillium concentricum]